MSSIGEQAATGESRRETDPAGHTHGRLALDHGPPADAAAGGRGRSGYELETSAIIRRRLNLTLLLFLVFVGAGTYAEAVSHPERRRVVLIVYFLEVAVCAIGLAVVHLARFRARGPAIAAAIAASLSLLLSTYSAVVDQTADTLAVAQVCLMTGVAVLLPWGWRPQLAVNVVAFAGFAASLVGSSAPPAPYAWLAVVTGATTSVWGAYFLDRLRFEAFLHTEELAQASAVKHEEAEVSSALTHVAQTLSSGMGRRDLFESVNRLAVQHLGCDWSTAFVFDEQRGAFRFCSNAGSSPRVVRDLADIEFPRDSLPLFDEFRPGELVEIPNTSDTPFIPADVSRHFEVASALYVPIWRGDQLVGVLAAGHRERRGAFSARQRRLALGIASAAAIALENERLIADLQAANRLKSEFVSTMSHELRTPLNVITGYAEMLSDPETGSLSGEQRDLLKRIQRNAETLLELISSTLDLGRLEAGRETVHPSWVDLHDLFAEVADEIAPLAQENGVALRWDRAGAAIFEVRTDRTKLKTILKNLVGNACKFAPGGAVQVSASGEGDSLVLTVADDGMGIAPEDQSAIFDMFRQVETPASRSHGGVGLGLHIALRLCERLGGTISVASTRGAGATFTVRLPAQFAARESAIPG